MPQAICPSLLRNRHVQVEAFLNRHDQGEGGEAVVRSIVEAVEQLGYRSWAYRIVNTAGGAATYLASCVSCLLCRLQPEPVLQQRWCSAYSKLLC